MSNRVNEIERLLMTAPRKATADQDRTRLNERFGALDADESFELLQRLLTPDVSRVPRDFLVLDRRVRLQLLQKLVTRLGSNTRAALRERLSGRQAPDPRLQKGLRFIFPAGTGLERTKFLTALEKPTPQAIPIVSLTFRSDGRVSSDNEAGARGKLPASNALGPDENAYRVWIEIQGSVRGHHSEAEYQFSRTIEHAEVFYIGHEWRSFRYDKPGTADNELEEEGDVEHYDEDRTPSAYDHIYVLDGPTPGKPPDEDKIKINGDSASKIVKLVVATEILEVKVGHLPWARLNTLDWSVVSWIERERGGAWKMNLGKSGAMVGKIPGLAGLDVNAKRTAANPYPVCNEPPSVFGGP